MYRGVGPPALVWENTVINLPKPKKGGRKERYEPLTKRYKNIDGEYIPGPQSWRFIGEYTFLKVAQNIIDTLIAIDNKTAVVKWIPHNDFPVIKYEVFLELYSDTIDGIIYLDTVKIKVTSLKPVYKKPSIDNMIGGVLFTRIGVIGG